MTNVRTVSVVTHQKIQLFVDKPGGRWIVRDEKGIFWVLAEQAPWEQRQQISLNDEIQLEPVPGHYKHMLGVPG